MVRKAVMSKNLIFGMATGIYSNIKSMDTFIMSLRKYSKDKVCIATDSNDETFVNFLKSFNVDVVYLKQKITAESVMYMRWILPKKVLNDYTDIENVILTDTRDVVFQDDPFKYLSGSDLDLSVETKQIKDCPNFNKPWVINLYGQEMYEKVKDNWILCAGVTAGKKQSILDLCTFMIDEHLRLKERFVDQAALNVFHAEGKLPKSALHYTGDNFVATIGHSFGVTKINESGQLEGNNGIIPAIVHQYDRHPNVVEGFYKNARA